MAKNVGKNVVRTTRGQIAKNLAETGSPVTPDEQAILDAGKAESEAQARKALEIAGQVGAPDTKSESPESTVIVDKTPLENALAKIGFKSAKQIAGSPDQITIKGESIAKLMQYGKTETSAGENLLVGVGLIGIDKADPARVILQVNASRIAEIASARIRKSPVKGARKYNVFSVYEATGYTLEVYDDSASLKLADGTIISLAEVARVYSPLAKSGKANEVASVTGEVARLTNGVTLAIKSGDLETVTGIKPAKGARDCVYADALFSDGTSARLVGYWIPGLMSKIGAQKLAIKGDSLVSPASVDSDEAGDDSPDNEAGDAGEV